MKRSIAAAALGALFVGLPGRAATTVDPAIREALSAPSSADREDALYALMRLHDPLVADDRAIVDRAFLASIAIERAALLRGACDRWAPDLTLSRTNTERVLEALGSVDVDVRSAAIDCIDRLPDRTASAMRVAQLEQVKGSGLPPQVVRAVLWSVARDPDARSAEILRRFATTELRDGSQFSVITEEGSWLILALAANGTNFEPMFSDSLKVSAESDYTLKLRLNAIRAAKGDDAALAAVIETANLAVDRLLRREAADLIFAMPDARRGKAVLALEGRLHDIDGPLRARIVREISREAASAAPATERMLVRAASDVFPDLRVQAVTGLFDRAAAGTLSVDALASARRLAETEKDPLVTAALRALFAKASDVAKAPAPSPAPSP